MDLAMIVGIVVALIAVWALLLVLFWALRPKGVSVREVVGVVPDVVRLLRSVIADRSAPLDVRLVLVGLLAWILSPIDLIPEFIPVLGPLDDVVVAVVAMRYVRRRVGVEGSPTAMVRNGRWLRAPAPRHRLGLRNDRPSGSGDHAP